MTLSVIAVPSVVMRVASQAARGRRATADRRRPIASWGDRTTGGSKGPALHVFDREQPCPTDERL